jgi:thiamine kinase-like enzyme
MRNYHQTAVETFMRDHFSHTHWEFAYPAGHGHETYLVYHQDEVFFVKLGSQIERYLAIASKGLTPPILAEGLLEDGTSIMVQKFIRGKNPTRKDFRTHLADFALTIKQVHQCAEIRKVLPKVASDQFNSIGILVHDDIQTRWEKYKPLVPDSAEFVDNAISQLREKVMKFQGCGLVASHNDINNSNWIITEDGQLFLIDLDSMSLDDPALDIGAILWWYYPPELRQEFLEIVGYADDQEFKTRMQVRMAMHCLNIILPRVNSFDSFDPESFSENLTDFKAIMAGEENPQGYSDN